MSSHGQSQGPLAAIVLAIAVIPPIAFFSAIPWLKEQPDGLVFLFGGIASTLTIGASFALSVLQERRLDEWHRTASRFSSQWGWTIGSCVVALLLAVPPIHDLIVTCVNLVVHAPKPDRELILVTFAFGFITVVLAQCLCTVALSVGWSFWMSRSSAESE